MAVATYYPTRPYPARPRKRKEGGKPPKGWGEKFQKYFAQEFIKTSIPFGRSLVRYYKYADGFTNEVKKNVKLSVADLIFSQTLGVGFRDHPTRFLYNVSTNAPKTAFFFVWNGFVKQEFLLRKLGYQRYYVPSITYKIPPGARPGLLRHTGVPVPRLERAVKKRGIVQHRAVFLPRREFGFLGTTISVTPGSFLGKVTGGVRFLESLVNPISLLSGASFRYWGWQGEEFYLNRAGEPVWGRRAPAPAGPVPARANIHGKEWISRGFNPLRNPRDIPILGGLSRGAYLLHSFLTFRTGELERLGWRSISLSASGGMVPDWLYRLTGARRGKLNYIRSHSYLVAHPRAFDIATLSRLLYYLHPKNIFWTGETWKRLGWSERKAIITGSLTHTSHYWGMARSFNNEVATVIRGIRGRSALQRYLLKICRAIYQAHPASWFDREYSFFGNKVLPYFRGQNWWKKSAQGFGKVGGWVNQGWNKFLNFAPIAALLARFPLLKKILTHPILKFIVGEPLKWAISPQAQIISYLLRGGKFAFNLLRRGVGKLLSKLGVQISAQLVKTAVGAAWGQVVTFLTSTAPQAIGAALSGITSGLATLLAPEVAVVAVVVAVVIVFIVAIFILIFVLPTSLKAFEGEGLGVGAVTIEKVARVEMNERHQKDKIGKNYLLADAFEHTIEYILTVKNNSSTMKIVSLTVTDNLATPNDLSDDLTFTFPPEGEPEKVIAPGASFELKRYGQQVDATLPAGQESLSIINEVEGAATLVGVDDPSETAVASFSDIGIFLIVVSEDVLDTGMPCGWPVSGRITAIFNQDMTKTGVSTPEKKHSGVDVASLDPTSAQEVFSTIYGFLARSYWNDDTGGIIKIKHPTGNFYTDFVHMSEGTHDGLKDRVGKEFVPGALVGETHVGTLTYSSGTHLHYRVRKRNVAGQYENVDPMNYATRESSGAIISAGDGCDRW